MGTLYKGRAEIIAVTTRERSGSPNGNSSLSWVNHIDRVLPQLRQQCCRFWDVQTLEASLMGINQFTRLPRSGAIGFH